MKIKELRSEFHSLIDQIEDPIILEQFYNGLSKSVESGHSLWDSLTPEQQQGVLLAYEESEDENNLVSLAEIKSKFGE